jgi:ADP-ribosylarginine hydrolase
MINKNEKLEAAMMISSYLETIGFYNGQWEFNYNKQAKNITEALIVNFTIINHYMSMGGFNYLDISNWKSSDDTLLLIATLSALIDGGDENDFINNYIKICNELNEKIRFSGIQTLKSLSYLKKITQKKKDTYLDLIPFDDLMSGNGAAIRTGPIGIFYANNEDEIIKKSIIASRLTHNIPIGYLGGLVSALFSSYAFNNIDSYEWINKLLKLVETKKIINYINSTDIGNKHDKEIEEYFSIWYKYKEERYNDVINFKSKGTFIYPKERLEAMSKYIPQTFFKKNENEAWYLLGASGLDSVIYAYDAFLMSLIDKKKNIYNPESLIFYSALHIGDSDSTGAIAGFWYGALLGYDGFDKNKLEKLEFYNKLSKLSSIGNKLI